MDQQETNQDGRQIHRSAGGEGVQQAVGFNRERGKDSPTSPNQDSSTSPTQQEAGNEKRVYHFSQISRERLQEISSKGGQKGGRSKHTRHFTKIDKETHKEISRKGGASKAKRQATKSQES